MGWWRKSRGDCALKGLEPFLDRWYLTPGVRWRSRLEDTLNSSKAVAIFVGPSQMGSWQQREVDVALDLQSRRSNLPVIPVLLPDCEPPLGFLRQLAWVDLRSQPLDLGITILVKAARGEPPGPDLQKHMDVVRASICPYRGLLHFREEDAPFFFGRESSIGRLMDEVQRQPFVAVVGASGSGKSSVVRAGLVPRLRSDCNTTWETVILVPTDQPLKALAKAFLPLLEPTMRDVDRLAEAVKLAEHFRSNTISLYDIVGRILEKQSGTNRVLIVVDQFEELYTLTSDEEARRRFLDELLATASCAESKANITLTLRGDFVGKALAYRPLSDRLQDAQINLGPMTREELQSAICKPAEKIGLEFEAGLVRRILNDVGDEPGNLPLLEFALEELWKNRRAGLLLNETYDGMGELRGALAKKAGDFFKNLSPADQKVLQRVFLRIVRPSESGEDTRRRAAFTELPPEGAKLVLKLANERLLVTNTSASGLEQTVEVAHEALISNWSTLRAWVNEDREFLLWRDRLGPLVAEWERAKETDDALLRGPLLTEAQKWFDQRSQDLSDQERKFISASREERERLAREEKERQEREIASVQKLAEEQKQRAELFEQREKERKEAARKLRRGAIVTAGAAGVALIFLVVSVFLWLKSERASAAAISQLVGEGNDYLKQGHYLPAMVDFAAAWRATPSSASGLRDTLVALLKKTNCALASEIRVWQASDGTGQKGVTSVALSGDGTKAVTGAGDGTVRLFDLVTGQSSTLHRAKSRVTCVNFHPTSDEFVAAFWDGKVRIFDLKGNLLTEFGAHTGRVNYVEFNHEGDQIVTASDDSEAMVWSLKGSHPVQRFSIDGHSDFVKCGVFSPDDSKILTASFDGTAQIWSAADGALQVKINGSTVEQNEINCATFSSDGNTVATAGLDGTIALWDTTGRLLGHFRAHRGPINSLQFVGQNNYLVTASDDGTAKLWTKNGEEILVSVEWHDGKVLWASISLSKDLLATAGEDGKVRITRAKPPDFSIEAVLAAVDQNPAWSRLLRE